MHVSRACAALGGEGGGAARIPATLGISLPPGNRLHPRDFERVLLHVAGTPEASLVNDVVLRSQSQAAYSPDNIGHFGLALSRYAHFTSPIRRYADLLIHRSLIKGLELGRDGLTDDQAAALGEIGDHITETERRAQLAERDAIDRYLAAFMAEKVGSLFEARISGVTRFGLFVTVTENGASGIVPMATLPNDFWQFDEREQTLTGRRTHVVFRLAQEVDVLLSEANPVTGGMVFHVLQGGASEDVGNRRVAFGETAPSAVIRFSVLLMLLVIGRAEAEPAEPLAGALLDADRLVSVYAEALTFIAPRVLDPIPVPAAHGLGPAEPDFSRSGDHFRSGGRAAAVVATGTGRAGPDGADRCDTGCLGANSRADHRIWLRGLIVDL